MVYDCSSQSLLRLSSGEPGPTPAHRLATCSNFAPSCSDAELVVAALADCLAVQAAVVLAPQFVEDQRLRDFSVKIALMFALAMADLAVRALAIDGFQGHFVDFHEISFAWVAVALYRLCHLFDLLLGISSFHVY